MDEGDEEQELTFLVFLARRVAGGAVLLAAVAAVTFCLVSLAPGDTAEVLAGQAGADPEYLALLRERLDLDEPLPMQIAAYLGNLARGDLGYSLVRGQSVGDAIAGRLGASALLAGTALAFAAVAGVALGTLAATRRGRVVDGLVSVFSLVAYSLPVFWLGQLLVALFAVRLRWLPAGGTHAAEGAGGVGDFLRHLVLPSLTLGMLLLALVVRLTRAAVIDALGEEFVTVARGKGAREARVVVNHVLPNALRPVITVLTGYVGLILTGAVLVETVFVWPGLGRLLYDSVLARDTPILVGIVLLSATLVISANFVADVLYRVLDPRTGFR